MILALLLPLALWLAPVEAPGLHRALAAGTVALLASPPARADLYRQAWRESRWSPSAQSGQGACGLWQQIPRYSRVQATCRGLRTRPVLAAVAAVVTYSRMRAICGTAWQTCYEFGPWHKVALKARKRARRG